MGSAGRRTIFVSALCTGVVMLGVSVHGLLGVDADLQRSAFVAQQQHLVDYNATRVVEHYGDCDQAPPPRSKTRT